MSLLNYYAWFGPPASTKIDLLIFLGLSGDDGMPRFVLVYNLPNGEDLTLFYLAVSP